MNDKVVSIGEKSTVKTKNGIQSVRVSLPLPHTGILHHKSLPDNRHLETGSVDSMRQELCYFKPIEGTTPTRYVSILSTFLSKHKLVGCLVVGLPKGCPTLQSLLLSTIWSQQLAGLPKLIYAIFKHITHFEVKISFWKYVKMILLFPQCCCHKHTVVFMLLVDLQSPNKIFNYGCTEI